MGYKQPIFQKTKLHKSAVASPVPSGASMSSRNPVQTTGGLKVNLNTRANMPQQKMKAKNEITMI